jgi:hypothetical protein
VPRDTHNLEAGRNRQRDCACKDCQEGGRHVPADEPGRPPDWRPEPQGTWLVIPYESADVGARPVPAGEVFWESPNIRVIGGDAFGNPTGGQPVTLEARVWNLGDIDAAPVRVDFAFVAPSLGIPWSTPQRIGTAWTSVFAGQASVATCPEQWTPPIDETDLHACLLVTCSAPAQHDTPTVPANPALDRHVGQRNLTVLESSGGTTMSLRLGVANLFEHHANLGIVAAAGWHAGERIPRGPLLVPTLGVLGSARAATRATTIQDAHLWTRRAALLDVRTRQAAPIEAVEAVEEVVRVRSLTRGRRMRAAPVAARAGALAEHADFASLGEELPLEPGQTGTAEVELRLPEEFKQPWLAVYLAQSQDDQLTGGYTVLIRAREG